MFNNIIGLDLDVTTPKILFNTEISSPVGSAGEFTYLFVQILLTKMFSLFPCSSWKISRHTYIYSIYWLVTTDNQ